MQTPAKFGEREKEGGREIERERERESGMPQAHKVYPSDGQAVRQRERERAECRRRTMFIYRETDGQTGRQTDRQRESGMPQAHNIYL